MGFIRKPMGEGLVCDRTARQEVASVIGLNPDSLIRCASLRSVMTVLDELTKLAISAERIRRGIPAIPDLTPHMSLILRRRDKHSGDRPTSV